ncbi:Shewanella-like protein phosphatase 2 [Diplonema papillatum]|nr:Shewanella-like protein phosphatase 2 [Diplonema papillatum]
MPGRWAAWLVCLTCACAAAGSEVRRTIAIGDLHGDLDAAMRVLKLARVVDDAGSWIGGRTVVVQLGDLTDRGTDSAGCVDLFLRLQAEAAAAGGEVVTILGNHELMNLSGDLRYVNPQEMKSFGGRTAWSQAWAPAGEYGQKLLRFPLVAKKGDTLFVHGGLPGPLASMGVDRLNKRASEAMQSGSWRDVVLGPSGLPWYRDQVYGAETGDCDDVWGALRAFDDAGEGPISRIVVGHTIQRGGQIGVFCQGALIAADIAMSSAISNRGYLGYVDLTDPDRPRPVYTGDEPYKTFEL